MAELVTDYMEGGLTRRGWLAARVHLLLCGACRRYFDQMRRTIGLLRLGEPTAPASEVEDRVLRAISLGEADPPVE
jgi:predicted anti-sigma-YlaC factor YlaD